MPEPKDDPIAPFARSILALYREDMRDVRFPDLDADSLAAAAEALKAAQLEAECIEAALASAREQVRERARELSTQAARGLSYARIFASGNAALSQRIEQLAKLAPDGAEPGAAPTKKRGRPRAEARASAALATKQSAEGELFAHESASEDREAAA